jgi:hypothetical protein
MKSIMMIAISGAVWTAYPSETHECTPDFSGVRELGNFSRLVYMITNMYYIKVHIQDALEDSKEVIRWRKSK